jgi:hypothetical protein
MSEFASYAGARAAFVDLVIPLYGLWSADVTIALDDAVPGTGPLVVGNMTLQGFVARQALYGGSRRLRLIGGFGGWRKPIPSQQYSLKSGVRLSLLLNDAAKLVGERVNVPNDSVIGSTFTRVAGPASLLLSDLAGESWYIDAAGVTQVATWPTAPIQSHFDVIAQDGAAGAIFIATEDYAEWVPGKTFSSPFTVGAYTVRGLELTVKDDGIARVEVLT